MSRYSQYDTFDDGDDTYDSRYDAGEFATYGRSRGPSTGTYSDGAPIDRSRYSRTSSSRQGMYDSYGYPMPGGYAGEQDLRRRISRYGESSSASYSDPRARLGRFDRGGGCEAGRRSRLSEQVYADDRQARREAREQQQAQLEYEIQERERRHAGYSENGGRSGRRDAMTSANDEYLAYVQAVREQQQREYDKRPANAQRYGRGYFPAYEWR
ncbi:hypothetical protein E8E12_007468 [Didymella heteroderae]|uniref:Uncharacterized protein n=1 Tax=Didymella heteroderae TaxID=1769908 RepID=A0A9P5C2W6_9PLEO|nr:hypothetical protein E8E12_007468 [Didymella heteroderae]